MESFDGFVNELLGMFTENPNCLQIMSKLSNKRIEINSMHGEILKENEKYKSGIKNLSVQVNEAKDFLEAEFPNDKLRKDVNPYKALKEYYETIIKELRERSSGKRGEDESREGAFIDTGREQRLKAEMLEKSLSQALEGYHMMVSVLADRRRKRMKSLRSH